MTGYGRDKQILRHAQRADGQQIPRVRFDPGTRDQEEHPKDAQDELDDPRRQFRPHPRTEIDEIEPEILVPDDNYMLRAVVCCYGAVRILSLSPAVEVRHDGERAGRVREHTPAGRDDEHAPIPEQDDGDRADGQLDERDDRSAPQTTREAAARPICAAS